MNETTIDMSVCELADQAERRLRRSAAILDGLAWAADVVDASGGGMPDVTVTVAQAHAEAVCGHGLAALAQVRAMQGWRVSS